MWFKNGLKAQKLLAQGIALGIVAVSKAPCKGKSLINSWYLKAFALTGRVEFTCNSLLIYESSVNIIMYANIIILYKAKER